MTESQPLSSVRTSDDVQWTASTLTVHLVIVALLLSFIKSGMPQFVMIYRKFDIELPTATLLIIDLARLLFDYWYLALILPIVEILFFIYMRPRRRSLTTWVGSLCTLLLFAAYAVATLGLLPQLAGKLS
jgi:type II secretory pathway component PulF